MPSGAVTSIPKGWPSISAEIRTGFVSLKCSGVYMAMSPAPQVTGASALARCVFVGLIVGHEPHNVTAGSFTFNIEAMPFIEFLCLIIDFEHFQSDSLGLLLA